MSKQYSLLLSCIMLRLVIGYDIIGPQPSEGLTQQNWECLARRVQYQGAIISLWDLNSFDSGLQTNLQALARANFSTIEGYVILQPANPAFSTASTILSSINMSVRSWGLTLHALYIVIDYLDGAWWDDMTKNLNYVLDFINLAKASGNNVGIHSWASTWDDIIYDRWNDELRDVPVWYYGQADLSFSDWNEERFGKFVAPYMKTYKDATDCGISWLICNWRPAK